MPKTNRRDFLKKYGAAAALATAAPVIVPACSQGRDGHTAPSDRVNLAFIGAGNQAGNDAGEFLKDDRVQITAVCDVNRLSTGYWNGKMAGREFLLQMVDAAYSEKYGRSYKSCRGYTDFREVLQRKDIDAVVVVTPDHWHAIPVLMAAAAGKDIYCQKPLALTIPEGRAMCEAVNRYNVVFQTGSQRRSSPQFRRICEIVRNGRIGQLHTVHVTLPRGTPDYGRTGHLTDTVPVPVDFDYDFWLGPAPEAPYCPARTHVNYRWVLDYSGGQLTDWGGHFCDMAQWGMGTDHTGPVLVRNARATWAQHPVWNTATDFYFECLYDNDVQVIVQSSDYIGVRFEGTEGSIWPDGTVPEKLADTVIGPDEIHLYQAENHYRNFIDCVLARKECSAPAEVGHRSITLSHLGNIALQLGQGLRWNPVNERFIGNDAANALLARPMREPWASIYRQYFV
jgi:myo-inositol 2-dehydrogenase / D-chiro-inositol 1-dehydrogenase